MALAHARRHLSRHILAARAVGSRRRRRRTVIWLLGLGAVLVVLALDAVWLAATVGREAGEIRVRLRAGAGSLESGQVAEAAAQFATAERAAGAIRGALRHPTALVAGIVPGLSDDLDAAEDLAAASEELARTGVALARAAEAAGWDGTTVPGLVAGGRIDTAAIGAALPDLERAERAVDAARAMLEPIRIDGLAGSLREAVVEARAVLDERAPTVRRAVLLAKLLPTFLGADEPRRYLLIAQNLSDPRGSGGHVGSHAVLEADAGSLDLGEMASTTSLARGPAIQAPPDVEARYERFGSLDRLMAATYPPDFATSARLLLAQWEAHGEEPVDGVISVDAAWMSYVLGAIGPVETPAWRVPLTAENVTDVLGRETFLVQGSDRSNALQAALASALWRALLDRTPQARPFGEAVARAARERHLQVYSAHPDEQALLEGLGAAGRVPGSEHPLQVTWFGASDSRAGYFAEKEVTYHAVLSPDGWAEATVTASLHNRAPDGPPSILLGSGSPDAPVGSFQAFVNVYLPEGARVLDVRGGTLALEEEEDGAPVVMGLIGAVSGGTDALAVTYRADGLVRTEAGATRFELDVLPQPALRPDLVRVSVELPPGVEVIGVSEGASVVAGVFTWEGAPATPHRLWVRFR